MEIKVYQDGDEVPLTHLLNLYQPHLATTPEQLRLKLLHRDRKYLSETYFAFSGQHLLGAIRSSQHAYEYHPQHFVT